MENLLKKIKLNESNISMILGVVVIAVVGLLVFNYYRSSDRGDTSSEATSTQVEVDETVYVVQPGDNLSRIADTHYGDNLKWFDIAEANNITDPNLIEKGQELIIPDLGANEESTVEDSLSENVTASTNVTTSATTTDVPKATTESPTATSAPKTAPESPEASSNSYEVQSGDTLWSIATSAYGDGYRWAEIAKANSLSNPNVIHHGNVLVLPQ